MEHEWRFKEDFQDLADEVKTWLYTIEVDIAPRREVANLIKLRDARFTRLLIKVLRYEDMKSSRRAFAGLQAIGEPAILPLIDCLDDEDEFFVQTIIWLLGTMGDDRAIIPLLKMLDNDRFYKDAINALGQLKAQQALPSLMKFLSDDNEWTRARTIRAIGYIGGKDYLEILAPYLEDSSQLVQGRTATVFAEYGDERARNLIETLPTSSFMNTKEAIRRKLDNPNNEPSLLEDTYADE